MVIGQRITIETFDQEKILNDLIQLDKTSMTPIGSGTKTPTGKTLQSVLIRADLESRLIIGLSSAINQLSVQPEETLFCILITPQKGDCATHMQEVLLKAFCFENDIYILQVDSAEKLGRLLNVSSCDSCVLVQRSASTVNSASEEALIDFCEVYWDAPTQPVVALP